MPKFPLEFFFCLDAEFTFLQTFHFQNTIDGFKVISWINDAFLLTSYAIRMISLITKFSFSIQNVSLIRLKIRSMQNCGITHNFSQQFSKQKCFCIAFTRLENVLLAGFLLQLSTANYINMLSMYKFDIENCTIWRFDEWTSDAKREKNWLSIHIILQVISYFIHVHRFIFVVAIGNANIFPIRNIR